MAADAVSYDGPSVLDADDAWQPDAVDTDRDYAAADDDARRGYGETPETAEEVAEAVDELLEAVYETYAPSAAADTVLTGYGEEDAEAGYGGEYREIAVVEADLGDGLFGMTRQDWSHVLVNEGLYEPEKRRTKDHEKTHLRNPGKDEKTIRYLNGDPEVRNTMSHDANNPARLIAHDDGEESLFPPPAEIPSYEMAAPAMDQYRNA